MAHFSHLINPEIPRPDAIEPPSAWVRQHAAQIRSGGLVLDLACGRGRNARWLASQGWQVEAVDHDAAALHAMHGIAGIRTMLADLKNAAWPYAGKLFDGIVVCRYLHRPLLPKLAERLAPGGVLIYETFMQGQATFGRPSNPDFLLQPDELYAAYAQDLTIVAFEQGRFDEPNPAMLQRICATKTA